MWRWFSDLDAARSGNGWSANPLSFTEIDAWARLARLTLAPWELQALRSMDSVRLELIAGSNTPQGEADVSERPLTPDLFDALFP